MTPCVGVRVSRWWEILTWCHTTTTTPPHLHTFAISHPPWPNLTRSKVLFIYCTINLERLTMVSFPCVVILIFSVLVTHWDTVTLWALIIEKQKHLICVSQCYLDMWSLWSWSLTSITVNILYEIVSFPLSTSLWNYKVQSGQEARGTVELKMMKMTDRNSMLAASAKTLITTWHFCTGSQWRETLSEKNAGLKS